jgi:hypothetical protein
MLKMQRQPFLWFMVTPIGIWVWLAFSTYLALKGHSDWFARSGAYGVSVIVLRFGIAHIRSLKLSANDHGVGMTGNFSKSSLLREEIATKQVEVAYLFIATLQVGFGDLLINKISKCGDWTC